MTVERIPPTMAEAIYFAPGTAIRIETLDGPEMLPLQAEVLVHDDDRFMVRLPAGVDLPPEMPVHCEVLDDDGVYAFQTLVRGRGDRLDSTALRVPSALERTQRR